jgi:hypothetical protein
MIKDNLSKNLFIFFDICESDNLSVSPLPYLTFKKSNYNLNRDEIMRASLRPNKLTLDNKVDYVKSDENAYLNRSGENVLKINYIRL